MPYISILIIAAIFRSGRDFSSKLKDWQEIIFLRL